MCLLLLVILALLCLCSSWNAWKMSNPAGTGLCLWSQPSEAGGLWVWGEHDEVHSEISSQNKKQRWLLLPSFHLCSVFTISKLYNIHKSCIGDRQNGSEGRSDCLSGLGPWVQSLGLSREPRQKSGTGTVRQSTVLTVSWPWEEVETGLSFRVEN